MPSFDEYPTHYLYSLPSDAHPTHGAPPSELGKKN